MENEQEKPYQYSQKELRDNAHHHIRLEIVAIKDEAEFCVNHFGEEKYKGKCLEFLKMINERCINLLEMTRKSFQEHRSIDLILENIETLKTLYNNDNDTNRTTRP
jgi:hypothetical protein